MPGHPTRIGAALAVAGLLLSLPACLKRKETVTIHKDGSATVELRIAGNGPDIDGGAARMPRPEVYSVDRSTRPRKRGDGKKHILTARAEFRSVAAMPRSHAAPADPQADGALTFDNELSVRREGDRTVYTFVRRYGARTWGRYRKHRNAIFTDEVKSAMGSDLAEKPPAVQKKVLRAILDYERAKTREWAAQALSELTGLPPVRAAEARAVVGEAVDRHFKKRLSVDSLAGLLQRSENKLEQRASRIRKRLMDRVVHAASDHLDLSAAAKAALRKAYRSARHDYQVTTDLGDERFEVTVRMPGEVQYDNGERRRDDTVVWKFTGKDLRDRRQTLIAVSSVEDE